MMRSMLVLLLAAVALSAMWVGWVIGLFMVTR